MSVIYDGYICSKEIGGYFELEIEKRDYFFHSNAIALNSARSCFQYLLMSKKPNKIYVPVYICNSMLHPLQNSGVEYEFYNIDENLEIIGDFSLGDKNVILYVNYFGLKSNYCKLLVEKYGGNLIIDNSQAFFEKPIMHVDTIYSARKFFGVSDGGYLYTDLTLDQELMVDHSHNRISHLVGRIENSSDEFYNEFRRSEESLYSQPIKLMSKLTSAILQNIDYEKAKLIRERNFLFLHHCLKKDNMFNINITGLNGPMIYPYLTNDSSLRNKLIKNKIYVAKYWTEILQRPSVTSFEKKLVDKLIPLPIDQRYNLDDMCSILKSITFNLK
jgi:hypothetical protein